MKDRPKTKKYELKAPFTHVFEQEEERKTRKIERRKENNARKGKAQPSHQDHGD
jgi:hypothetical protein